MSESVLWLGAAAHRAGRTCVVAVARRRMMWELTGTQSLFHCAAADERLVRLAAPEPARDLRFVRLPRDPAREP